MNIKKELTSKTMQGIYLTVVGLVGPFIFGYFGIDMDNAAAETIGQHALNAVNEIAIAYGLIRARDGRLNIKTDLSAV